MSEKNDIKEQSEKSPSSAAKTGKEMRGIEGDWGQARQSIFEKTGSHISSKLNHMLDIDEELPLATHIQLFTIAACFFLFILWASFASLDEVTRGEGRVIPSREVQVVQNLEGGIVEEILTWEGEEVDKGEVLMRLRDVSAASDYASNRTRYLSLQAAIKRLQAEADGESTVSFGQDLLREVPDTVREEQATFRANRQRLRDQRNILEEQLRQRRQEVIEIQTRIDGVGDQISLTQQERRQIEPAVRRGSLPQLEMLKLDQRLSEQDSELNTLQSSLPRARAAIDEVSSRLRDITSTFRADAQSALTEKQAEASALEKSLSALEDRKVRTEIRSPVDGIIKDIKITTVGGVVQPGQDLIEIVPKDDKLLVEARIRPSDIAFLYPGQNAVVKITAYDFSIYGGLKGELVDISADTIEDQEGNNFYRVRVRTQETSLNRKGEVLPIIPGMVASVDILTGEKTVMEYLLKPFIKTLDNAMNER